MRRYCLGSRAAALLVLVAGLCGFFPVGARGQTSTTKTPSSKPASNAPDRTPVILTVNGQPLTEGRLERMFQTRRVPADLRERVRSGFLEQMIDAELVRAFLESRNTKAVPEEVNELIEQLRRQSGDKSLADLGYTDDVLRAEFELPLAWKRHMERLITQKLLQEYYARTRAEFDGTKVRVSHIVIRRPTDASEEDLKKIEKKLADARQAILRKELTFAEAARIYSEGPSGTNGGDIGEFTYQGKMPEEFTRVVFALKQGELSEPFRTKQGVHIAIVNERKPGDLALEDVRDQVVKKLSQDEWARTVKELRGKAKLEWKSPATKSP